MALQNRLRIGSAVCLLQALSWPALAHCGGCSPFCSEAKPDRGVDVQKRVTLPVSGELCVSRGSAVSFRGDAIVNAANQGGLGGGGVDGAINRAGGPKLVEARKKLPLVAPGVRIPTGSARITIGGDLPSPWVIHAVGPNFNNVSAEEGHRQLESAYAAALEIASKKKLATVGFSLLSAGVYRGDQTLQSILETAVRAVRNNSYEGLEEVHLVGFTASEVETLAAAADAVTDNKE